MALSITSLQSLGSLFDLLSVTIFVSSVVLLYTAHRSFQKGVVYVLASRLMVVALVSLALRALALVDIQIFSIENYSFYRAVFGLVVALVLLSFSSRFLKFAGEFGFEPVNKEKSLSDKKLAKALGGG